MIRAWIKGREDGDEDEGKGEPLVYVRLPRYLQDPIPCFDGLCIDIDHILLLWMDCASNGIFLARDYRSS